MTAVQRSAGDGAVRPGDLVEPAPPARAAAPRTRQRLIGIDAARGVALLGMITLHALWESDAAGNPTWSDRAFSGRAAAAFALLAGVGIAFVSGRRRVPAADRPAVAAGMAARAVAIGVVGFLVCAADTTLKAVILPYLAVVFLLAIPLVFLRTWTVAVVGLLLATAGPVGNYFLLPRLPEPELGNPSFIRLVQDPIGMLTELTFTGFYPSPTWLAYVCVGIVIGRQDLSRRRFAALLLAVGTAVAVAAHTASTLLLHRYGGLAHIWAAQPRGDLTAAQTTELLKFGGNGNVPSNTWWWLAVDTAHTGTPPEMFGAAGCAVAVLGLMLLAAHVTHRVLGPVCTVILVALASAGSMTLTFYSAHILFINSDFDTYSAGNGCLVQVVGALLIGLAVRGTVGRGPLEAAVAALANRARRLTTSRGAVRVAATIRATATIPVQASPAPVSAVPAASAPALAPAPASAPAKSPESSTDSTTASAAQAPAATASEGSGSGGPAPDGSASGRSGADGPGSGGPAPRRAQRRPHGPGDGRRRTVRRRAQPGAGQGGGR